MKLHCTFKFDCQTTTAKIPYALLKERSPYYDVDIWNQSLQQCSNTLETLRKTESTTYTMHLAALFRSYPCRFLHSQKLPNACAYQSEV